MKPKMMSNRIAYGDALVELGKMDTRMVVMDADLSSSTRTGMFAKVFPERFFNVGIAEANMMCIAAGLASTGRVVFASSFAMFATGRVYDQIRQSIAYPNLNVKIVATHAGITVGGDGASHQINEDLSLMRVIPQMTILSPADYYETKRAVYQAHNYNGPVYIRLGRSETPVIFDENYDFRFGVAQILEDGSDVAIMAIGPMVGRALEAAKILRKQKISAMVINMSTIKPIDKQTILKAAKKCGAIVSAEEHSIIGGLGTAISEVLSANYPVPQQFVGIPDVFGESGESDELMDGYGLRIEAIVDSAKKVIARKA
jgi:transketolase